VWTHGNLDFQAEDGTIFKGDHLHKQCYHCYKLGQVIAKYAPGQHDLMIEQSKNSCRRLHMYRCPSEHNASLRRKKLKDYADDF